MANRISTQIELNRSYDVDFGGWSGGVVGSADFVFGDRSTKTTGIVKASNRFLKMLLTYKGTDPFNLERGTYFDDLHYMGGDSISQLGTYITKQIDDAYNQVKTIQANNSFPEDENISSVILTDIVELGADHIAIYLKLTMESGEETTVYVPIIGG